MSDLLANICYHREPIVNWKYFPIGNYDNTRMYYKPEDYDGGGFKFYVVDFVSGVPKKEGEDNMPPEETTVACLLYGEARFDGLRHIWMGDPNISDDVGYIYYPDAPNFVEIFSKLRELEFTFCQEPTTMFYLEGLKREEERKKNERHQADGSY